MDRQGRAELRWQKGGAGTIGDAVYLRAPRSKRIREAAGRSGRPDDGRHGGRPDDRTAEPPAWVAGWGRRLGSPVGVAGWGRWSESAVRVRGESPRSRVGPRGSAAGASPRSTAVATTLAAVHATQGEPGEGEQGKSNRDADLVHGKRPRWGVCQSSWRLQALIEFRLFGQVYISVDRTKDSVMFVTRVAISSFFRVRCSRDPYTSRQRLSRNCWASASRSR